MLLKLRPVPPLLETREKCRLWISSFTSYFVTIISVYLILETVISFCVDALVDAFLFVLYVISQIVPVMLHYLTKLSTVRLYLPKDLRPSDNRFSVGKSIQVRLSLLPLAYKLHQCKIQYPMQLSLRNFCVTLPSYKSCAPYTSLVLFSKYSGAKNLPMSFSSQSQCLCSIWTCHLSLMYI